MALMLTGDTGETAVLAREERLHEARLCLLHPIKFMLASPSEDAAAIMSRLGPTVWVEDKYDGIRAQLHRRGSDVRLYSRDLHDVSHQFPEIIEAARPMDWDAAGQTRPQGAYGRAAGRGSGGLCRLRSAGDRAALG
jgi:DNA ligase-1